jgi:CO dehydrogenase/acetyl-CoA synthase beta subunit
MPDFIFHANIAHYKDLLATETDARKIAMIRKLLEEEEHKLTEWQAKTSKPKAAE